MSGTTLYKQNENNDTEIIKIRLLKELRLLFLSIQVYIFKIIIYMAETFKEIVVHD